MGSFVIWHWLVVIILVMLLFGRGRISDMMGDFGKGLKSFKQGLADEDEQKRAPDAQRPVEQRQIPPQQPIDITPQPPRSADPETPPPPRDDSAR